jgi:hypothetical protein
MRVEEGRGTERLFRVLAMMPDEKLAEMVSVLEQAKDLSNEELEARLADVFESRAENLEESDDVTG